jgi:tetratricopeptide (TPR) repeat protein
MFDCALADLDDRGLVGWDRRANRYDLHPIVRGVVWNNAGERDRLTIAERMSAYFKLVPALDWKKVERLEDLTPAIELYVSLIRLGRHDAALEVFQNRLSKATLRRLHASWQCVELLEMLFQEDEDLDGEYTWMGRWETTENERYALNALGLGLSGSGQPGRSLLFFRRTVALSEEDGSTRDLVTCLDNLSLICYCTGALYAAEASAFRALALVRAETDKLNQCPSLGLIGLSRAARGLVDGDAALRRSFRIRLLHNQEATEWMMAWLAQSVFWSDNVTAATRFADRAWELSAAQRYEHGIIRAARLQGQAAVALGRVDHAEERLHYALRRAHAANDVEEELPTLTALATLHVHRGETARAREHLDAIWDAAERGPYPLLHADARNVLAEIEMHEKNVPAAIEAATTAYRLAWCDGPPFAYHYGLRTARAHLQTLGAPAPDMPPFDPSKHEPIEEIPIDPEDEGAAESKT